MNASLSFLYPRLQGVPAAIIDLGLQPAADDAGHTVIQYCVSYHEIIPFLIEEQLSSVTELGISLAILVGVRSWRV